MELMITSGFNFEGYKIVKYYGVYSGECVLGTGFLSGLGASFADFFGTNSKLYSEKLKNAKEFALKQLFEQVKKTGANAIIGLDIDYTSFSSDIMGVITNGTAVKIESIDAPLSTAAKIDVINYNPDINFRPSSLSIVFSGSVSAFSLDIEGKDIGLISSVFADIKLITVFEDEYDFPGIGFTGFCNTNNPFSKTSANTPCHFPEEILQLIKSAKVTIRKYIKANDIFIASENDHAWVSENQNSINDSEYADDKITTKQYIATISLLNSASEILKYTESISDSAEFVNQDLLNAISLSVNFERLYGNSKEDCLQRIKEFLSGANE